MHATRNALSVVNGIYLAVLIIASLFLASHTAAQTERMSVAGEAANIRANPDPKSPVLWQIERYHPIMIVEKKGSWFRFKDFEGHLGWVHKSLLGKTSTVIVRVRRANFRSGPGTEHGIVFDAEKGTPFKVLSKKEGWLHVQHADGDKAWVFKSLVW